MSYDSLPPVAPRKRRRKWPWILFAVLALFVFIIVFSSAGTPTQQTSSGVGSTTPVPAEQSDLGDAPPPVTDDDAAAILAFGQPYDADGLQVTAGPPTPGDATLGATYCTTVSYVNGSDDSVTFGPFDWKMVDTEGVESTAGLTGNKSVDSGLGQGILRPGGKTTGQVCFNKQGVGTPEQIILQGGLFVEPVVWRK